MHLRAALLAALATVALHAAPAPLRILFVGNSLTYTNDLPRMVARIGAMDGRRIVTETLALPNFSLEDHLAEGELQKKLAGTRWDVLVMQQGPSSLAESRRQLIRDVTRIAALPQRRAETVMAVLMVWPPQSRQRTWRDVAEAHRLAAAAVNATLIPAGTAIETALVRDPQLPLLGADGFHPAPLGTYLAALATYQSLVGPLPPAVATEAGARKVSGSKLAASESQLQLLLEVVKVR